MKAIIILLCIGATQTTLAHVLGVHGDLPHMQYEHWGWYVFESLFYTGFWGMVILWLNEQDCRSEQQQATIMKEDN